MKNSSRIYTNMQASKHAFSFLPQMRGYATKEKPKASGKNSYYNKNCRNLPGPHGSTVVLGVVTALVTVTKPLLDFLHPALNAMSSIERSL